MQTVQVGGTATSPALQFTPNSITAPNGTVVTFRFTGVCVFASMIELNAPDICALHVVQEITALLSRHLMIHAT